MPVRKGKSRKERKSVSLLQKRNPVDLSKGGNLRRRNRENLRRRNRENLRRRNREEDRDLVNRRKKLLKDVNLCDLDLQGNTLYIRILFTVQDVLRAAKQKNFYRERNFPIKYRRVILIPTHPIKHGRKSLLHQGDLLEVLQPYKTN